MVGKIGMPTLHKLKKLQVDKAKGPTRLQDGGGLSIKVSKSGAKAWVFTYRFEGKRPEIGLGGYPAVSISAAREKAAQARGWLAEKPKKDPRLEWLREEEAAKRERARVISFGDFVEQELPRVTSEFVNEKHKDQWRSSLTTYCAPIWAKPLASIGVEDVASCISPHWQDKRETMSRVRGRIERLLDSATAKDLREGDNPARWSLQQHCVTELSREDRRQNHHAAHHYLDMPSFFFELRQRPALSARAFEFAILTAARSGEVRGARWREMHLKEKLWVVPASRMKAGREHIVPLSTAALHLLQRLPRVNDWVFWSEATFRRLGENAMLALIKRIGNAASNRDGQRVTVHGCARSSFKDWAGDMTEFDDALTEAALAHTGSALHQAYRRKSAVEKRRVLMQAWADFLASDLITSHTTADVTL